MVKVTLSFGAYREISQPFETIFDSNSVEYQKVENQSNFLITFDEKSISTFTQAIETVSEQFDQIFTNPVNIISAKPPNASVILQAYEGILQKNTVSTDILQAIEESLNPFSYILKGSKVTIYDFVLHELTQRLFNIQRESLESYPKIGQFIAKFETTESLQPYIFNQQNLIKPFSHYEDNVYSKMVQIVKDNINTLADFALLENSAFKNKYQLQSGQEGIFPEHIPFSPSPVIMKKNEFMEFYDKAPLWNKLIQRMSKDLDWILEHFEGMNDPFLQGFISIAKKARTSTKASKYSLGIIRNDVMHSASTGKWLQIEFNTISVSFGYIAEQVQALQKTIKNSYLKDFFKGYETLKMSSVNQVVKGLAKAHELYNRPETSQILIVVSSFEGNSFDQRYPEYLLARDHGILCKRRTFEELIEQAKVNDEGVLTVQGDEISVVYFRTGYSPDHFPNENIWKIREKIELTQAIKCPPINLVLVGFKKIQKVLQEKGQLERFLTPEESEQIRQNFAKIYGFEDEKKHHELMKLVEANPEHYVLKPQREGGANNTYGKDILPFLNHASVDERKNYILMEKIIPQPSIGLLMRNRQVQVAPAISELGIISVYVSNESDLIQSDVGGYLVRTKRYFDDEGGVVAGFSVIDGLMVRKEVTNN